MAKIIVNKSYNIHVELGPGLLESVYEEILFFELIRKILKLKDKINPGLLGQIKNGYWLQG